MTKAEFQEEFEKLKRIFVSPAHEPNILFIIIRRYLEKDFSLIATKRTRKDFRRMFGNRLDNILANRDIADEDYFRIYIIKHFDIEITLVINNQLNSLIDYEFKNTRFSSLKDFQEIFQEDWEDEIMFLFKSGKLYDNREFFQTEEYNNIISERSKLVGNWEGQNIKLIINDKYDFVKTDYRGTLSGDCVFLDNDVIFKSKERESFYNYKLDGNNLHLSNFNYGHFFTLSKII
jgi:hypothetical protein